MGLVNALGNLGGFVGPYVGGYLQDVSGSFLSTSVVLAIALLLGGLVMITLRGRANPGPAALEPERAGAAGGSA
jgi:nitrate/nitrite transporter NarK